MSQRTVIGGRFLKAWSLGQDAYNEVGLVDFSVPGQFAALDANGGVPAPGERLPQLLEGLANRLGLSLEPPATAAVLGQQSYQPRCDFR